MQTFRNALITAAILLAVGPAWAEIGKGVPGMYQKIYSGSDVSTGDPEDGGVVIAAGAGLLAVAAGNPSISYTDPVTSTKYTLAGNQTVAYKGVMKLTEGKTYWFVKSFDDNGHIRIISPDGTVNNVLDNTSWSATAYGSYTATVTEYHTLLVYCGNGSGGVGPANAPFTSDPYASIMWNDVGLTQCTAANKSQWHRLINNEDGLGTYLYTDIPDADWPKIEIREATVSAGGEATVSFVLTEGKGDITVEAVDSDGTVKSVSVGSAISASETVLSGVITGLEAGRSYALNVHAETTIGFKYDFEAGSAYFGEVSVAAGQDADYSTLDAGTFVISRPADDESVRLPLEIRYVCSGAIAGTHYVMLSDAAVLPAGATSVTVKAWPLPYGPGDYDLTLTLEPAGRSLVGTANSATIGIHGSSTAQEVRFLSNDGDDSNDGLTPGNAFQSLNRAIAAVESLDAATIMVVPGLYETTDKTALPSLDSNHYVITNAITVLGMGACPSDTHFRGTGSNSSRCRVFFVNNAGAKLKNLLVSGGHDTEGGANVRLHDLGGTVEDCVISNGWNHNWCQAGGGIHMNTGRVLRTVFVGNLADNDRNYMGMGSALRQRGGQVENCLFTANGDGLGGHSGYGTIHIAGDSTLANCTIAGNTGKEVSGIFLDGNKPRIYNCAIFNNNAMSDGTGHSGVYFLNGNATLAQFVNCAADRDLGGSNLYAADGGFVDPISGDYHLSASSVCRDSADESHYIAPQVTSPTDLEGNPRLSGTKRGNGLDIGCYEFDSSALSIDVMVDNPIGLMEYDGGLQPCTASFHVVKNGGSGEATYSWDFEGDGTVDLVTTDVDVTHDYTAVGTYSVVVSATDSSGSASVKKTDIFATAPKTVYVDATSASPTAPYVTRETAARSVTDAYAAILDGSTILVKPGVYEYVSGCSRLNIQKAVRIVAEGLKPEDTVFTNALYSAEKNNTGTFFRLMNPDALVANMLFVDCSDYSYGGGSGITIESGGGTVSNCVFRHCGARSDVYCRAGGAAVYGGLVTHSVFDDCYIKITGNMNDRRMQGAYVSGKGCLDNCLFKNCHSDSDVVCMEGTGTTMKNCTIVDCSVTYWTGNTIKAGPRMRYAGAGIEVVDGGSHDGGKVYNTVIANVSRSSYEYYTDGAEAGQIVTNVMPATACADWTLTFVYSPTYYPDTQKLFKNCATEDETPINDTCFTGTAGDFFRDAANGDYRPRLGSVLRNHGMTLGGQDSGTDLVGRPRVIGSSVDIGCYELSSGAKMVIR